MKRSLSKNPNMLRTMIGTGLTLIVLLAFAVYSNTVDSEYYEYATTNENQQMELTVEEEGQSEWFLSTNSAITWVNFSVDGAPVGSILTVEAEGTNWSHSPSLGLDDSNYICNEPESDYSSLIETCDYSRTHSMVLESGNGTLRGRVSLELPIKGKGYLESSSMEEATARAQDMVSDAKRTITWKISISQDGEVVPSAGLLVTGDYAKHELIGLEKFKIDPIQETVYSFSALVGCFFMALVVPLMIYFAARYRDTKDEEKRSRIEEE